MQMLQINMLAIGKNINLKIKRIGLSGLTLFPVVMGFCGLMTVIFSFPLSATSKCSGILQFALPSLLLVCVALELLFSVVALIKGRFVIAFLFLFLTIVLFCFFLFTALIVGPSLTDMKREIERVSHIPSARLKCIGGRLFREAEAVFSFEGVVPSWGLAEDASGESSVVEAIRRVSALENITLGNIQEIRHYSLEAGTLLVVRNESGYLLFYLSKVTL